MSINSNSDSNVKIDISANADGVAPGVDQARSELDKLTTSTSEFEKRQQEAINTSERMEQVTGRTREQFVQLGKEVINGDTGRMPGTLASIAMGMLPVSAGVLGVGAAVAAGVWAWNEWGNSAEDAAKKASSAFKDAEKDRIAAEKGIRLTLEEQIRDLEYKRSGVTGQLEAAIARRNSLPANVSEKQLFDTGGEVIARRRELDAYERQISDIQKKIDDAKEREEKQAEREAERELNAAEREAKRKEREAERELSEEQRAQKKAEREKAMEEAKVNATIELENSKYEKLHEMAVLADATDSDRVTWKLAFDLQKMEEAHQKDMEKYANHEEIKAAQEDKYQQARIDRVSAANSEIEKISKAHEDKQIKASKTFGVTIVQFEHETSLQKTQTFAAGLANMTAIGAKNNRALFEINKIAALADATISGWKAVQDSYAFGAQWGGPIGGASMAAIAVAATAANLAAISSTQFGGGGGGASVPSGGGGSVPSQATSPGVPVTQAPAAPQTQAPTINIYNTGNLLSNDYVQGTIIPQIQDAVMNNDVVIINPRSRQAQMLGA